MRHYTYISGLIGALYILSSAPAFAKSNLKTNTSLQTVTNISALPNTAESYFQKGYQLLQTKDYQGAINNFNQALAISPKLTKTYYFRGFARYQLGDIKGAKKDFVLSPVDYVPDTISLV
ncbi:tetratricopeptide repeat/protein kinase domain protein [Calothrix sp. NIES-4071]|nr:tetratricopeptide repeat/protein kinase domain protein [Calothrix sp. NIES-4071]BAZ54986.1 tetratricopeptide repeat/protein kinase domain protein [Calothrix sp. NIES-4105]